MCITYIFKCYAPELLIGFIAAQKHNDPNRNKFMMSNLFIDK